MSTLTAQLVASRAASKRFTRECQIATLEALGWRIERRDGVVLAWAPITSDDRRENPRYRHRRPHP